MSFHLAPVLFYNLMCSKETNKAAFCSFEDVAVNLMIGAIQSDTAIYSASILVPLLQGLHPLALISCTRVLKSLELNLPSFKRIFF